MKSRLGIAAYNKTDVAKVLGVRAYPAERTVSANTIQLYGTGGSVGPEGDEEEVPWCGEAVKVGGATGVNVPRFALQLFRKKSIVQSALFAQKTSSAVSWLVF